MSEGRRGINFPKIVTILAVTFGIAFGLCGLNYALIAAGSHRDWPNQVGTILVMLGVVELGIMAVTGPLLVITVIAWVITGVIRGPRSSAPTKLLDDSKKDGDGQ
jgi:hypothetical protein